MVRKILINLPVKELKVSMDFFRKLGFQFRAQFTDDTAAGMIVSEDIYRLLLTEDRFKVFTPKQITDANQMQRSSVVLVGGQPG